MGVPGRCDRMCQGEGAFQPCDGDQPPFPGAETEVQRHHIIGQRQRNYLNPSLAGPEVRPEPLDDVFPCLEHPPLASAEEKIKSLDCLLSL